jgi:hypothetical protein
MICSFADIAVKMETRFSFLEHFCADYRLEDTVKPSLCVRVTDAELEAEIEECLRAYPHLERDKISIPYVESICLYRNISLALYDYDAFLLHASAVCVDGRGYAFAAKSGTGKSTHSYLWKELLGDRFSFINGDKPIVRLRDGVPYLYGTPFAGKEGENNPVCAPLHAIAILCRDSYDHIEPISRDEAFFALMHQILHPSNAADAAKSLDLLKNTVSACQTYRLYCTPTPNAANVAYEAMKA